MMKFVFASDSFKGTLSSRRVGELLTEAAHNAFPQAECIVVPMADGGEGTLDAIACVREGVRTSCPAHDGLMRPLTAPVFVAHGNAFVEAASSCGLTLLAAAERNPLLTSSYGVGECIRYALDLGLRRITVGLGGVCTNDGGMGCLRALGVRFLDDGGNVLPGRGADLECVAGIDASGLDPRIAETTFILMSDVRNPLLGSNGATHVFGPQKGADPETAEMLEAGMHNLARAVARVFPNADFDTPGFGAAGGLGMALSVFLGARMESGIETLLTWTDFDQMIADADLVVTGEGRMDGQTLQGKVVQGVAEHALRSGVPVAAVCGSLAIDESRFSDLGLRCILQTSEKCGAEFAMQHAEECYRRAALKLFERIAGETGAEDLS